MQELYRQATTLNETGYIEGQNVMVTYRAIQRGRSTEVAKTTLEALEESLRAFEKRRRSLLDRLKERER
jgi:hypothetical protein